MKRLSLLMILIALAASMTFLAGCGHKPQGEDKIMIGLTVPSLSHPFFIYLTKNVMDEAEKLGVKVIAADVGDVAAKQMSVIEDFIIKGVDGVLMSPIKPFSFFVSSVEMNLCGISLKLSRYS